MGLLTKFAGMWMGLQQEMEVEKTDSSEKRMWQVEGRSEVQMPVRRHLGPGLAFSKRIKVRTSYPYRYWELPWLL